MRTGVSQASIAAGATEVAEVPSTLDRNAQGIRREKIVIDATALGELQRAPDAAEHVIIDADLMQRRIRAVEQDLKHDIVRAGLHRSIALRTQDNLVSDDVPQITRRKHRSFHERERAIVDHSLVLAIDQADRQSAVEI